MKKLSLALGLSILASPVLAGADKFNIDPAHSQVGFKIRHFFSQVPGRFTKFQGEIDYDAAKPEASRVNVEIDASSVNTDNADRDNHLRSGDFFDVQKFPKLTFKSKSVKKTGKGKLAVTGELTMRDKTQTVVLDAEVLGTGPDPWGNVRGGFHGTTTINRKDFGMIFNKTLDQGQLMLGDDVAIDLNIEAIKAKESSTDKQAKQ